MTNQNSKTKMVKKKKNPFKFRANNTKPKHTNLAKRHAQEKRFKIYCISAVAASLLFLVMLFGSIVSQGTSAFVQTQLQIPLTFSETPNEDSNFEKIIKTSLKARFPDVKKRKEKFMLYGILSNSASEILREKALDAVADGDFDPKNFELWFPASSTVDMYFKGKISTDIEEGRRKIKDRQLNWLGQLDQANKVRKVLNIAFFTNGDSREPEQAGVLGSSIGSIFTILICMLISFPIGVGAAVYLEEFAKKNKLTDIIEVNINNLAAVPSVIFGLLALAVYLNFFGMPRSSSLVGGFALSMLVLPTIVIATRNALKAVPPSIRDAARAMGATDVQVVIHHTLPYSLPGIMTGTILGVARALGETAPLLMIGMVAFVADVPKSIMDPATSLPTQIYLWADSPELGFIEKTSAAIIVLLVILALINGLAAYVRKKFEYKW